MKPSAEIPILHDTKVARTIAFLAGNTTGNQDVLRWTVLLLIDHMFTSRAPGFCAYQKFRCPFASLHDGLTNQEALDDPTGSTFHCDLMRRKVWSGQPGCTKEQWQSYLLEGELWDIEEDE